jgi:hypothetical protein
MYSANRKCSSALKVIQNNVAINNKLKDLNVFNFNREIIKQNALFYSTNNVIKPIRKLMVANRGRFFLI